MLVTSISSFSLNVFKKLSPGCLKSELQGKGLKVVKAWDILIEIHDEFF